MGDKKPAKKTIKKPVKRGLWLTKDNKLIVMEAVMNPLEYKAINYFMIKAVEKGQMKGIEVKATDLINDADIKKTGYTEALKKLTKTIVKTSIHIEELSKENKKTWTDMALIPRMTYEDGTLICDFNDCIEPYIFGELQSFTRSRYAYIVSCRTYSAMRMYEICNSWRKTTKIAYYDVPKWRAILGAVGTSYTKFPHFRQKILEPAIKEVNEKTDLAIEAEYIKTGRAITHVKIYIKPKEAGFDSCPQKKTEEEKVQINITPIPEEPLSKKENQTEEKKENISIEPDGSFTKEESDCLTKMTEVYHLSAKLGAEYLHNPIYGLRYCQEQMEYTRKQNRIGNVRNIGGYLKEAIEKNYASSKKIQEKARQAEINDHEYKKEWNLDAAGIILGKKEDKKENSSEKTNLDTTIREKEDDEAKKLWDTILKLSDSPTYKPLMGLIGINAFLPSVIAYKKTEESLYLEVKNNFAKEWFENRYSSKLNALASIAEGKETDVRISIPKRSPE